MIQWLWGLMSWLLMPLLNESGQIPSTTTDAMDALLTTTLRAYQPTLHDNITRGNKFLSWMQSKGRFRTQDGGERISIPLMHAQSSSADIYSGYGTLDTTPQDGITTAFYEWSQLAASISINRLEERKNSGRSRILSLLEAKTKQATASVQELLNNCLVAGRITASASLGRFLARTGRLDSGASGPLPLGAIIDANASRSVTIGNINGSTYSFWRNFAVESTLTTWAGYFRELSQTYNNCSRGTGGPPDLMLGDQRAWEIYWNGLRNQERYIIDDKGTVDILGGSDALKFRGATFIWDEVVPDVETNAEIVDAIGTANLSNVWFINTETLEWVVDSMTDFITTPFLQPVGQDARVAEILWMGALTCNNRRKNGVLYGVDRTIAA